MSNVGKGSGVNKHRCALWRRGEGGEGRVGEWGGEEGCGGEHY